MQSRKYNKIHSIQKIKTQHKNLHILTHYPDKSKDTSRNFMKTVAKNKIKRHSKQNKKPKQDTQTNFETSSRN